MLAFMTDIRTKYVSFHSSYWDSRKTDGQPTFHLTLNIRKTKRTIELRQTDKFFFLPRYWNRCKDNRRTNYVSFHQLCWHVWQTDKIRFISLLILGFKEDKRTTFVSFNPQSTQDKRTIELRQMNKLFFHPRYWNRRKAIQPDKLCFISSIVLAFMTDRRPKYVSFHSWYWDLRKTDGQSMFRFTHYGGIYDRQTYKIRFI